MNDKIQQANSIADFFLKYGRLLFIIVVGIGGAFLIYNQIQYNSKRLELHDEQFKELLQTMNREFEVHARRSDNRYKRAMQTAEELNAKTETNASRLYDINGRLSYIEGKLSK